MNEFFFLIEKNLQRKGINFISPKSPIIFVEKVKSWLVRFYKHLTNPFKNKKLKKKKTFNKAISTHIQNMEEI